MSRRVRPSHGVYCCQATSHLTIEVPDVEELDRAFARLRQEKLGRAIHSIQDIRGRARKGRLHRIMLRNVGTDERPMFEVVSRTLSDREWGCFLFDLERRVTESRKTCTLPDGRTVVELAEAWRVSPATAYRRCRQAVKHGLAIRGTAYRRGPSGRLHVACVYAAKEVDQKAK